MIYKTYIEKCTKEIYATNNHKGQRCNNYAGQEIDHNQRSPFL